MIRLFCVVLLALITQVAYAQQSGDSSKGNQTSTIPAGEAHFTPAQLKEYYLVYKNADVRYLRTLFDAYVRGARGREEEYELLRKWDKDYYRSKFVVMSREENTFGGTLITIMFQDRPDKVFVAWVYPEGDRRRLTLKGLDLGKFSDEDIRRMKIRYRQFLEDKVHAM
jgi:hypothetical protein